MSNPETPSPTAPTPAPAETGSMGANPDIWDPAADLFRPPSAPVAAPREASSEPTPAPQSPPETADSSPSPLHPNPDSGAAFAAKIVELFAGTGTPAIVVGGSVDIRLNIGGSGSENNDGKKDTGSGDGSVQELLELQKIATVAVKGVEMLAQENAGLRRQLTAGPPGQKGAGTAGARFGRKPLQLREAQPARETPQPAGAIKTGADTKTPPAAPAANNASDSAAPGAGTGTPRGRDAAQPDQEAGNTANPKPDGHRQRTPPATESGTRRRIFPRKVRTVAALAAISSVVGYQGNKMADEFNDATGGVSITQGVQTLREHPKSGGAIVVTSFATRVIKTVGGWVL